MEKCEDVGRGVPQVCLRARLLAGLITSSHYSRFQGGCGRVYTGEWNGQVRVYVGALGIP